MLARWLCAIAMGSAAVTVASGTAPAWPCETDTHCEVSPGSTVFGVEASQAVEASQQGGNNNGGESNESVSSSEPLTWTSHPICEQGGAALCYEADRCSDGSVKMLWIGTDASGDQVAQVELCPADGPPSEVGITTPPVDIPGEVAKQFKQVSLPESTIIIQPPGGETLVNFNTILATKAEPFTTTVQLDQVNIDVTLDIYPIAFTWHHGDGTTQRTDHPGGTWDGHSSTDNPHCLTPGKRATECVLHNYTDATEGNSVSVDTVWGARFQVNGQGPWEDVAGTVTRTGAPATLDVLEAHPSLVY